MASLTGRHGRVAVTSVTATSSTDNAAVLSTDGVTLTISSTGKRHWPQDTTSLVVAVGGTPTTDSFTADYVAGVVSFTTPHSTSATYTIDVESFTASFVGYTKAWEATVDADIRDQTVFSTSTADTVWRSMTPGLIGGSVTLDRFIAETTGPAFFDRLAAGAQTVVELWQDYGTRSKLEGYAYVGEDGFELPVDGDAEESVTLTLDGALSLSTV